MANKSANIYNFSNSKNIGHIGETDFGTMMVDMYGESNVCYVANQPFGIQNGVDFAIRSNDGVFSCDKEWAYVDVKTDTTKHSNIFLEDVINEYEVEKDEDDTIQKKLDKNGNPILLASNAGWMGSTKSEYIAYYYIISGITYIFKMSVIRRWFKEHKHELEAKEIVNKTYKKDKETGTQVESRFYGTGYPAPLSSLWEDAEFAATTRVFVMKPQKPNDLYHDGYIVDVVYREVLKHQIAQTDTLKNSMYKFSPDAYKKDVKGKLNKREMCRGYQCRKNDTKTHSAFAHEDIINWFKEQDNFHFDETENSLSKIA